MQHEITAPIPLLDEQGNLTEPGYAKRLLPVYDRSKVRAGLSRLKEWDYYLVMGRDFALALTIADNSYMGMDSVSFLDFRDGWQVTKSPIRLLPMGRTGLPATSLRGNTASSGKGYALLFHNDGKSRTLTVRMERFRGSDVLDGYLVLTGEPEESMVICTPFDQPGQFFLNQKINCIRAEGYVTVGRRAYRFAPSDSFAVLDWGRGVWPYHNTWYWASASGLVKGVPFGFNLGCGFGNTEAATENMLFYNGRAHKLSQVAFHIPGGAGQERFMEPWTFTSDDGRFEMSFVPVMDRASSTGAAILKSDQHQVFGRFTGTAVLDGGESIQVKDFMGFAEKVENKW